MLLDFINVRQLLPGCINLVIIGVGDIKLVLGCLLYLDPGFQLGQAVHVVGVLPVSIEQRDEALSPGLEAFCLGLFVSLRVVLDVLVHQEVLGRPLVSVGGGYQRGKCGCRRGELEYYSHVVDCLDLHRFTPIDPECWHLRVKVLVHDDVIPPKDDVLARERLTV